MKPAKNLSLLLLSLLILFAANGCKKYENGPLMTLKSPEKRLQRAWQIESYFRNGIDETNQLLISNYEEEYTEAGSFIRSYTEPDNDLFSESGQWNFDSDKMQIKVIGMSSLELTDQTSTVSTSDFNILKLTSKKLWYTFENGSDVHEFHLTAK